MIDEQRTVSRHAQLHALGEARRVVVVDRLGVPEGFQRLVRGLPVQRVSVPCLVGRTLRRLAPPA